MLIFASCYRLGLLLLRYDKTCYSFLIRMMFSRRLLFNSFHQWHIRLLSSFRCNVNAIDSYAVPLVSDIVTDIPTSCFQTTPICQPNDGDPLAITDEEGGAKRTLCSNRHADRRSLVGVKNLRILLSRSRQVWTIQVIGIKAVSLIVFRALGLYPRRESERARASKPIHCRPTHKFPHNRFTLTWILIQEILQLIFR